MRIPVLCYHSGIIHGATYALNDHTALESDLHTLADTGFEVLPALELVRSLRSREPLSEYRGRKLVCLTFDDGYDYDYWDVCHLEHGYVRSFYSIIKTSQEFLPLALDGNRAVSFVIASPFARAKLKDTCSDGAWGFSHEWWAELAREGIVGIGSHSWDHLHDTLDYVRQRDNAKGSFHEVKDRPDAEMQVLEAQATIMALTEGHALPFFCYPYGHASDYLVSQFFPAEGVSNGISAAFQTGGEYVTEESNVWAIPRFVCGEHWRGANELKAILEGVV